MNPLEQKATPVQRLFGAWPLGELAGELERSVAAGTFEEATVRCEGMVSAMEATSEPLTAAVRTVA